MTSKNAKEEKKTTGICWDENRKAKQQAKQTIQLEIINQKVLMEEWRLKLY